MIFKNTLKKSLLLLIPISGFLIYENTIALTNVKANELNSEIELQINNDTGSNELITDSFEFSGDSLKPKSGIYHDGTTNEGKLSDGVIGRKDYFPDNGKFVFDLNADYEQVVIDVDLLVRGQYDFFGRPIYSVGIYGDETLLNSKEEFKLEGIIKKGETIKLGSADVLVIDDVWHDKEYYEAIDWSGTLSEDGTQFTLFVSNSRRVEKYAGSNANPFYGIYQIYNNVNNEVEYHHSYSDGIDVHTDREDYKDNAKLTFEAQRSWFDLNDVNIDIEETNENIYRIGTPEEYEFNIDGLSQPFFTKSNTYSDVERILLDENLIVAKDATSKESRLPNDYLNLIFYDANGSVINESTNLTTNEITIDIVGKEGTDDFIRNSKTDILLDIPFVPIEFNEIANNLYDFSYEDESDPTDNVTTTKWVMEDGKWTLKTNSPFELSLLGEDFESFTIGNSAEYLVNGQDIRLKPYQVVEGQSNKIDSDIKMKSKNDYEWIFNYDFDVEDENGNIEIKTPAQMSNGILLNEDEGIVNQDVKKVFDMNGNGQIESKEIFSTSQVFTDFYVEHDSEDYFIPLKWDKTNKIWEINEQFNYVELIQDPGIYGFSSIDEYGNNTFELVEYLDTNDSKSGLSSSQLQNWVGTSEYEEDLKIARDQGVIASDADADEFNNVRAHELRKINDQSSENMVDLDKVVIDNELLQNITASYVSDSTFFGEMRDKLELEIERQLQNNYGINLEDIKINWNKSDFEEVSIGEELTYSITPGQTWITKNEYGFGVEDSTFEVASYVNLSLWEGEIDDQKLANVTNSFEQGETFKDVRKKLEIAIKDDLKTRVNNTDSLDFKWNISDEESIYYDTEINFSITSKADNILGTLNGVFKSETYFDLKHIDIDKVPLQEITLDYEGKQFGDYRIKLEEEINNQIDSQGYPKDYIQINWNNFDSEVLTKGENIDFSLSSKNERIVHNEYDRTFDFGIPPAHKNSKKTNIIIYSSIFLSVILMILVFIFIAYRKKAKYNKELKRRTERNRELIKNNEFIQRTLRDKEAENKDK